MDITSQTEVQNKIAETFRFNYPCDVYEEWFTAFAAKINDLILNDFEKLIFILYLLDIDEVKIRTLLRDHAGSDAGILVANLIIERQFQKIQTRQAFKHKDDNIPEDEKW